MKRSHSWTPQLDATGIPSYLALASALIADIRLGRLMPGDPLPSQRMLAKELDLSLTTITRAFKEAHRRGFIVGQRGRGTFVNSIKRPMTDADTESHQASRIELSRSSRLDRLVRDLRNRPNRTKGPASHSQPEQHREALEAAASWLKPLFPGIDPNRVVVFENEGNALVAVLNSVIGPDSELFVEALVSPALLKIASLLNVKPVPIDIDAEGLVPEALEAAALRHKCRVLYCSPTFQNPSNSRMDTSRRQSLVSVARKYGITIIENGSFDRLSADEIPLCCLAQELCYYTTSVTTATFGAIKATYVLTPTPSEARSLRVIQTDLLMGPEPLMFLPATRAILDRTADTMLAEIAREVGARTCAARSVLDGAGLRIHPTSPFGWLILDAPLSPEVVRQLNGSTSFVLPEEFFAVVRRRHHVGLRVSFGCFESVRDLMTALTQLGSAIQGPRYANRA